MELPSVIAALQPWQSFLSRDESSRASFVGIMTSSVNGTTDTRSKPPTSYQAVPPVSHATTANTQPAITNDACMTVARR